MASLGILSGSQSGYLIYSSTFSPFPFDKAVFLTTDSPFSCPAFSSLFLTPVFSLSIFSRPLFVASLAYCPARRHYLSFSSPSPFFFFCPPLLSPSPSALPSPVPIFSQGVCPKWLRPTWQHLFVVLAQCGRSSPCRAPLARCHLCFTAVSMCRLCCWRQLCRWMLWTTC